jgi:hypothetical protein
LHPVFEDEQQATPFAFAFVVQLNHLWRGFGTPAEPVVKPIVDLALPLGTLIHVIVFRIIIQFLFVLGP